MQTIDQQEHYRKGAVQPIVAMMYMLQKDYFIGYLLGNCMKYRMRDGLKEGTDDKAKFEQYYKWYSTFTTEGYIEVDGKKYSDIKLTVEF